MNPKTTATGLYIAFHELIQSRKDFKDAKVLLLCPKINRAAITSLLKKLTVPEEGRKEIFTIIDKYCDKDTKSLKRLCQKLLKTHKDLTKYDNMFLYLTGLLTHQGSSKLQEYSADLMKEMERRVPGNQSIEICDGHTGAAMVLFKYLDVNTPVKIILENEVSYVPYLDDMLHELSKRKCEVELSLRHQWKHEQCGFSDNHLNCLYMERKKTKRIHVMPDVQPDNLPELSFLSAKSKDVKHATLFVSKVGSNWIRMCNVIRALLPVDGNVVEEETQPPAIHQPATSQASSHLSAS
ncbi:hypothetical protein E2C01_038314 [Portunus trituberculatus]|uniref:Uncharacterized protein n=1 Tax=Portunus trituberculatus TaxID=210409 RepID=A0A5B7FGH8_PORTR|nr:hypothetical protein [Portunus trituberculatus]